jgi:DNA-binding NarL/FixJ family response regulator
MTNLLLADDHTMLREGLRKSLEAEGLNVVGEAQDGGVAVEMALQLKPNVVLMDVSMPVIDGVEATRRIRESAPEVSVVMLTMHADSDVIRKAIAAGAVGYLVKDCTTEEIVRTVRQAADDDTALSQELAASLLKEAIELESKQEKPESVITKREEEVLQLIADGASTAEVADKLFISVKTVKNHLVSIYQKLETSDRTQAVLRAARMGIIRLQ